MYSLLIVDDEKPVIDSISYMLGKFRPQLRIAGTARSGKEALEIASRTSPDILMIDVRMPGIDGLETVREIKRRAPRVLPILTTAYERFEIARTALELGVVDYILKPFSRERILAAVDAAVERLDTLKEHWGENLRSKEEVQQLNLAAEALFFRTLSLGLPAEEFADYFRRSLPFSIEESCIAVLRTDGRSADREEAEVTDRIVERIKFKYRCLAGRGWGSARMFLFPRSGEKESYPPKERLDAWFREAGGDPKRYRFTYGRWVAPEMLLESLQEALEAQREPSFHDSLFAKRDEDVRLKEGAASAVKQLTRAIRSGDAPAARQCCEVALAADGFESGNAAARSRLLRLLYGAEYELERETEVGSRILAAETPDEVLALCGEWLHLMLDHPLRPREEELPKHLKLAVQMLHEQYDSGIQLSELSEAAGVTPSYLSHLFSKHCKMSFIEYLTQIRLEKAGELLASGDFSVKEVSAMVGYRDPNYFSRMFKKQTGSSPSDFTS